jgi:ribosomal protein S12 methylthiotransferase
MAAGRLLPYLDVPLQHASPRVLRAMRRPADAEDALERIGRWRQACPELTVRSTFIVGFPGETEAEFEELLAFLEAAELDRVGCFAYSPVAAAANALPGAVPEAVKDERRARLMALQEGISARRLARRVGARLTVLVDALTEEGAIARSAAEAPEIDGQVIVPEPGAMQVGELYAVRVTGAGAHDLWAERA